MPGKKKKWVEDQTRYFPKVYEDCQQVYEMMLNIINHQGSANQNHNEISSYTSQNDYHRKEYKSEILERMWRKGNPPVLLLVM